MPVPRALRLTLLAFVLAALAPAAASAASTATFEKRFSTNDSGNIAIVGNTLMSCPPGAANCATATSGTDSVAGVADNDFTMAYVDVDADPTTFDSSTATLSLPSGATVLFAGLYWGARTDAGSGGAAALNVAAKNTALLRAPGAAAYATVTATGAATTIAGDSAYQHVADVTDAVQAGGSGVYGVANVQAGTGADRYAGWSLVVAYRDLDQPPRNLSVFDGLTAVSQSNTAVDINVSGFTTAPAGPVRTTLGAIAYEGDLGKTGDGMKLAGTTISDASNPATDLFNSSVSVNGTRTMSGRSPAQRNHLGFDADLFAADNVLTNRATSATITVNTAASNGETIYPGVLTFASELLAAKVRPTTTVTDLNGGNAEPGDELEYVGVAENTGNGAATGLQLKSEVPAGVELVPGSLELLEDQVTGSQSAQGGDDRVTYDAATRTITWDVGTGATPTAGGSLAVGGKVRIRYRVKIGAPADGAALPAVTTAAYGTLDTADQYATTGAGGTLSASSPDLAMDLTRTGELVRGQAASFTLGVANVGSASSRGAVRVTDTLPAGLDFAGTPSGDGWGCSVAGRLVSCERADELAGHASFPTITVPVRVRQSATGGIVNAATVTGEGDGLHGNDSDSDDGGLPAARAALALALSGATTISPGETATITARVTNAGPSDATGVQVALPLPAGLTLVSAASGGQTCVATTCPVGTVPAGGAGTAVYVVRAKRDAAGSSQPLTATSTSAVTDTTAGNDSATATVAVRDLRLVSVTQSVAPDPLVAGAATTIALAVGNDGPSTATGVVLSEPLPAQLRNATAEIDSADGTCAIADGALRCDLAPLADGGRIPVTVRATVRSDARGAALDLTASVAAVAGDPDASDDAVTVHRTVEGAADLSLTSVQAPATLRAGERATWEIRATDGGPGDATGTMLSFPLPAGMRLVIADGATCTTVADAVTCAIGTIAAGEHRDVSFALAADPGAAAGAFTLAAALRADEPDPDSADAHLDVTGALTRAADLRVTQTGAAGVVAGAAAAFATTVTNAGPSDATTVVVTETVPANVSAATAAVRDGDGTCAAAAGSAITCRIARLPVGERRTIDLSGTVTPGAGGQAVRASARASAAEPDAQPADNEAGHAATAATVSDVSVSALAPAGTIPAGTQAQVTLRVRNDGPSNTDGVVLTQTLPAAAQPVDLDPRCTVAGQTVTCQVGALVVGDERPIVIKVRAIRAFDGATLGTGASVAAQGRDPQPANDSLGATAAEPVRCASRRRFTIHLRVPATAKLTSVSVVVAGLPVRVRVGRRLTAVVDLRTRPAGRILVRIRAVTRGGRAIVGTRAYQTCTVKRPTVTPPRV